MSHHHPALVDPQDLYATLAAPAQVSGHDGRY
jgi:hypothetical protein